MNDHDESNLNDLLDGLLGDAETRALRERLVHEPELAHAWQEMRRLRHLLRQDDGLRAPPDFGLRVRERLHATRAGGAGRAAPGRAWAWLVPAAAVILLGLALGHRNTPDVERKEVVLHTPTPSLLRKRARRAGREADLEIRTLTLLADSLNEGKARLDDLLAGQVSFEGLLLETPPEGVVLGASLRRVTRAQYLRLCQVAGAKDDADHLPPTFDVRVVMIQANPIQANSEGAQGTR